MSSWIKPIYDRELWEAELIALDPLNYNQRGAYNYVDLNRVETNTDYVQLMINTAFGESLSLTIKTDWTVDDIPELTDIERIRTNIETLQTYLSSLFFDGIEHTNTMNYEKANVLERNLRIMKENLDVIVSQIYRCGTFYCGDMPLFGKEM